MTKMYWKNKKTSKIDIFKNTPNRVFNQHSQCMRIAISSPVISSWNDIKFLFAVPEQQIRFPPLSVCVRDLNRNDAFPWMQAKTRFVNNTFSLNHYLLDLKFLRLQNKSETLSHFITVVSVWTVYRLLLKTFFIVHLQWKMFLLPLLYSPFNVMY